MKTTGIKKRQEMLAYIAKKHGNASITSLIKLCYLSDLISIKKNKKQISDYKYVRYTYGPFDKKVYLDIEMLISSNVIKPKHAYSENEEYTIFEYNDDQEVIKFEMLNKNEIEIIDNVLEQLAGYGAKALTEIAYKTPPMESIGATIGGTEHFNEPLNMNA